MRVIRVFSAVLFLLFTLAPANLVTAQQRLTVSGRITDQNTGETLIGVSIGVVESPSQGALSNEYGFYSLTLPTGRYTLAFTYLGYATHYLEVDLVQSMNRNVSLQEEVFELDAVEVTGKLSARDANIMVTQMGVQRLNLKETAKIPVLFGEKDPLKSIQLLPGINSSGDGSSGFHVRGGTSDQNLILLDEAPVFNASHLMGFFSTFNSDAIKDVVVYKGSSPAQYGGRLSSVLDVKMNDGNNQRFVTSGGIGLIASRLNLEGPIQRGKSSFIVSGRRTYADLFMKLSSDPTNRTSKVYFYDLNAKLNFTLGPKDRIYFSGYFGRDLMDRARMMMMDWGNLTGTLRWNHIMHDRLFVNTSFIYSDYDYRARMNFETNAMGVKSGLRDLNFKHEYQWFPSNRHQIRFGLNSIYHRLQGDKLFTSSSSQLVNPKKLEDRPGWENALYFSHEWAAAPKLSLVYGLRMSSLSVLGPGTYYSFDARGKVAAQQYYRRGQFVKNYFNPEPRLSINYKLAPTSSIKAGYTRNAQYLHLAPISSSSSPMDVWVPTSINVKPEQADQYSLGYFRNFADNMFELSTEVYYKQLYNQIDYRNGTDPHVNEQLEGSLLYGHGRSYGVEVMFKKREGRFSGWLSYTLSRTEKQIEGINDNNWYPSTQDHTHDISLVGIFDISRTWSVSAVWIYYTGNAVTFPGGKYTLEGGNWLHFTQRNAYRMPDYHRLDLSATWISKKSKKFESSWNFSLYNAYGRRNAFSIIFREQEDNPTQTEAVRFSLFQWVPSVTYNFKF